MSTSTAQRLASSPASRPLKGETLLSTPSLGGLRVQSAHESPGGGLPGHQRVVVVVIVVVQIYASFCMQYVMLPRSDLPRIDCGRTVLCSVRTRRGTSEPGNRRGWS